MDLIFYAILGVLPILGLLLSEGYIKRHPQTLRLWSLIAFVFIYIVDVTLPIFHSSTANFRPAYSTQLIIACYVFFSVSNFVSAFLMALLVTISHVLILVFITYKNSSTLPHQIAADVAYLICVNAVGVYFRLMSEIMKRITFLDRRACVQSTITLNYEKDQQVSFNMLICFHVYIHPFRHNLC